MHQRLWTQGEHNCGKFVHNPLSRRRVRNEMEKKKQRVKQNASEWKTNKSKG